MKLFEIFVPTNGVGTIYIQAKTGQEALDQYNAAVVEGGNLAFGEHLTELKTLEQFLKNAPTEFTLEPT